MGFGHDGANEVYFSWPALADFHRDRSGQYYTDGTPPLRVARFEGAIKKVFCHKKVREADGMRSTWQLRNARHTVATLNFPNRSRSYDATDALCDFGDMTVRWKARSL
jgi:hypothetical protein